MEKRGQSLGAGAALLLVSAVVVKLIGALFKVPLTAMIGGEGMGYYMTAFSVFTPVYAVSVAGLPAAISRTAAALGARAGRVPQGYLLRQALIAFLPPGLLLGALLAALASPLSAAVGNAGAADAVRAIAPAVFLCAASAVFRGVSESGRNMVPTAASQCVEALVRLAAGLFLAWLCVSRDPAAPPQKTAAAVLTGVTLSVAAGTLTAALFVRFEGTAPRTFSGRAVRAQLRAAAVPVCLAALIANLSVLIDLATVMNRLSGAVRADFVAVCQSYPDAHLESLDPASVPNFLFGSYTALAMTVFHLVPALTLPLATSALPLVSALHEKGNSAGEETASLAVLKCTALIAFPAGIGAAALASPILLLLFGANPQECAVAAKMLRVLGAASTFSAMAGPANNLLQARGRPYAPVRLLLCGMTGKAIVNLLLIGSPNINLLGAAWGTLFCAAVSALPAAVLLLRGRGCLQRLCGVFLPPVFGGLLCAMAADGAFRLLSALLKSRLAVLPAVGCGVCVYLLFLALMRPLNAAECAVLLQKPQKNRKNRVFSLEKGRSLRYN